MAVAALPCLCLCLADDAAPAATPRRIAVTYFDNDSGDPTWDPLRKGLADMIITDLSSIRALQLLERDKLGAILDELKLQRSKLSDPQTAVRVGRLAGAEYLLAGSYQVAGDRMRIDARVIAVAGATVVAASQVSGRRDEFFELEKELCELLTGKLEVPLDTGERARLRRSQTESFEAFSRYARGLDAVDRGDREAARAEFDKALAADPKYQAARSALDKLGAALETHGRLRAKSFTEALAALDPAAPDFASQLRLLPERFGGPNDERQANELAMLAWLARKGHRPWRRHAPGPDFTESERSYLEFDEVTSEIHGLRDLGERWVDAVLALEYLHDKYPDPWGGWLRLRERVQQARRAVDDPPRDKGPGAPPPESERGVRLRRRLELFADIARVHRAAAGKRSLEPAAVVARLEAALEGERRSAHQAFDAEFRRRLAALDPADEKNGRAISELESAADAHFERFGERAEAFPCEILLLEWIAEHGARPFSGTRQRPYYIEEHRLLRLALRFSGDEASADLLPPVLAYVLSRYADDPVVESQVRLHKERLEGCRGDGAASCRRDWERSAHEGYVRHADLARALFKRIAALGPRPAR